MAMNLLYLKVLIITLAIQWISIHPVSSASQTQIYPLFTAANAIGGKAKSPPSKGLKELGNSNSKKRITIKPALLRASSLTSFRNSLLKKPHLTLFNKPSSIAFLNKKYLPQSLELLFSTSSGSSGKGKQRLPTYQLATSSLGSIDTANLKSTGTDKLQFITKPLFIPISGFGASDNSQQQQQLKKLSSSWSSLLNGYSNFNNFNNQLSPAAKTSLPVFVFSSEKYNFNQDKFNFDENKYHNNKFGEQFNDKFNEKFNEKFNDNNSSPTKLGNNGVRNSSPHHPNAIQDVSFYSNSNDVNQTSSMKAANYNGKQERQLVKQPQFSHDFKPIVSGAGANGFRTGRTIGFDKGQIRQQSFINEVKQSPEPQQQQAPKFDLELIDRTMDRSILSTIEKDIKLNNIKFIKSIIKTGNTNNNANRNTNLNVISNANLNANSNVNLNANQNAKQPIASPIGPDKLTHPSQPNNNQLVHGSNQIGHNSNGPTNINLNSNNYQPQNDQHNQVNSPNSQMNHNNHVNQPQNFQQQQSVHHVLKLQSNNNNNPSNSYERDKQMNGNNMNNNVNNPINKEDRPEKSGQVKMPKFKIIQYADKGAIEEFTRALENIDFKSITQNELAGLPEFVYDKLGNARIETIIGHRENAGSQQNNQQGGQQNNQQSGQQNNNYIMAKETNNNDYKEKSPGAGNFQPPPQMHYFGNNDKINSNDCAKNRKLRQMNSNGPQAYQGSQQGNQQMNQQMSQQMNQQMNQPPNYQQQQGSSSQQKSYFNNDQSNSITLNSLVNFDDQASFYSTSSTKLRQLKVLPNSDQMSPGITSPVNDNQFSPMNGNAMSGAGQATSQIGNQISHQGNNQLANQINQNQNLNQNNQMSRSQMSQSGDQQPNQMTAGRQQSSSGHLNLNLNNNNELNDDFKKEINDDETDQFGDSKKQPTELDIETGDESAGDQLDNLDGVSKKLNSVAGSGEADSLDPTKLDLKIIHLPVSVLKKLVQADGKKRRKR